MHYTFSCTMLKRTKLQLSTYMDGSMDFQQSLSLLYPVQQLNTKISELWPGAKNSTTVQVALFKFVCFLFVGVHRCFFFSCPENACAVYY